MRFSFLPPQGKFFFEFFVTQAEIICEAARLLKDLVDSFENVDEKVQKITDLEHKGDEIQHEISVQLNKTFITPIDREDIHQLSADMDDILDFIQGSAIRMKLFKIKKPTPETVEIVNVIVKATDIVKQGVELLPTFKDINVLVKKIKELEREGDRINRSAIAGLFEKCSDPLEVIKWKEIYESLETVTDKCEDVFDVLEGVVLKHA